MEETIDGLLALNRHSLRVTRVAADTVRVQVVDLMNPSELVLDLQIDVHLDPVHRWYSFTTLLYESNGASTSQHVGRGRLRYRVAGVSISLDGVHSHEFDADPVFDLLEQRLRALEWRPKPGFWDRLFNRAG